jgi:hypothetical protein
VRILNMKKIAAAMCCVLALTAVASAGVRLVIRNLPIEAFPGVDDTTALDGGTNLGFVTLNVNLATGLATATGRANVPNLSFKRVVFYDQDLLGLGVLIGDKYTVTAKGKATYSARYADVTL